jgi:hypothetical protein
MPAIMSQLQREASATVEPVPQTQKRQRSRARSMASKVNSGRKAVFRWASGRSLSDPKVVEASTKTKAAPVPKRGLLRGRIGRRRAKSNVTEPSKSQLEIEEALPENVNMMGWLYLRDQWRWRQRYCVLHGQFIEVSWVHCWKVICSIAPPNRVLVLVFCEAIHFHCSARTVF